MKLNFIKKTLLLTTLFVVSFSVGSFFVPAALAHGESLESQSVVTDEKQVVEMDTDSHGEVIEVVLADLLSKQQVKTIQDLKCDQVSEGDWERLGEASMEQRHSGVAHQMMDRMMGGEGSESLRQAHIRMGQVYLGCSDGEEGFYGGMMTASSLMGFGGQMMSGYGFFPLLFWSSLTIFLLTGSYYFIKRTGRENKEVKRKKNN